MLFRKWVANFGGPEKLAAALGVSSFSVRHWLRGEGTPRLPTVVEILKLSKGAISVDDILKATQPATKKRG